MLEKTQHFVAHNRIKLLLFRLELNVLSLHQWALLLFTLNINSY
nr:MAG TPA: hypothetical protein [Siphoviridae sp. ctTYz13]